MQINSINFLNSYKKNGMYIKKLEIDGEYQESQSGATTSYIRKLYVPYDLKLQDLTNTEVSDILDDLLYVYVTQDEIVELNLTDIPGYIPLGEPETGFKLDMNDITMIPNDDNTTDMTLLLKELHLKPTGGLVSGLLTKNLYKKT